MPPSGYSKMQSQNIGQLLILISNELKKEGIDFNETPKQALEREILDIDSNIDNDIYKNSTRIILELTRWLYKEILSNNPKDYKDFDNIREKIIADVEKGILDVNFKK